MKYYVTKVTHDYVTVIALSRIMICLLQSTGTLKTLKTIIQIRNILRAEQKSLPTKLGSGKILCVQELLKHKSEYVELITYSNYEKTIRCHELLGYMSFYVTERK